MRQLLIFTLAILSLSSCNQNRGKQAGLDSSLVSTTSNPQSNLNIQVDHFSQIDSSDFVIFPLSMGESVGIRSDNSFKHIPQNNYWNVAFHNTKTRDYHLLSDRKMIIRNIDLICGSNDPGDHCQGSNYIFYTITTDDLNKDKKLTGEDPEYLFVSDKQGKNFRQISPPNTHLRNWKFLKKSNELILTAYSDSDKNSKFDDSDEIATFQVNMSNKSGAKEIFDSGFKSKLKDLYNRDWKLLDR
jgi:hypothetical protein